MDAVDEGDNGGSLSRECKLPLEPLDRGQRRRLGSQRVAGGLFVRRSSAIFLRRSSGGSGGWFVAILPL